MRCPPTKCATPFRPMASSAIVVGMLSVLAFGQAWATDGYLAIGYGTQSKGMAGAGLADPKDALAIANNPAAAFALGTVPTST